MLVELVDAMRRQHISTSLSICLIFYRSARFGWRNNMPEIYFNDIQQLRNQHLGLQGS